MRVRRSATGHRAVTGISVVLAAALCAALTAWHPSTARAAIRLSGARAAAAAAAPHAPAVAIVGSRSGAGYWIADADGRVASFGDAGAFGDMSGHVLAHPIVGMAATADGAGYWLVASDGGIFAFGDATFHGSTGAIHLVKPVVGMAATADGAGYWLVASDGGIFAFGDATFHGSTGAIHLVKPVVAMAATPSGGGYWFVASDGGVFTFGDARFLGSDVPGAPVGPLTTTTTTTAATTTTTTAHSTTTTAHSTTTAGATTTTTAATTTTTTGGGSIAPTIDASTPPILAVNNNVPSVTSGAFSPPAGSVLYAAFSIDSLPTAPAIVSGVSGGGLTWHLLGRANAYDPQTPSYYGVGGLVEVWWAYNPSVQSGIIVTGTFQPNTKDVTPPVGALQVLVMDHAAADQSSAAWSKSENVLNGGAPGAQVTTTRAKSLVLGVFDNWDSNATPVTGPGQSVYSFVPNAPDQDYYWIQAQTAATAAAGTSVTMNATVTNPSNIRFHVIAWEVLAA